jgi:hypothetical protein
LICIVQSQNIYGITTDISVFVSSFFQSHFLGQNTCLMCMRTWAPFPALITSTQESMIQKQFLNLYFFKLLRCSYFTGNFLAILVNILYNMWAWKECIFCWFQMQYSVYVKLDAGDWWCYSFQQFFDCYFHSVSFTYKDGNILVSKFNIGFVYFFL